MQRTAKVRRGCVWALVGVAVLVALVPWRGVIWDGGFPPLECRLKFVDGDGKPVPGVTLTVFTKSGAVCHFYPVEEFVPDVPVISDAEGRLVFHHSSTRLEFGGHEYSNMIGMRFGETSAPHYDCVFIHKSREVFRTPYNFHRSAWTEYRKADVKRQWAPPWDAKKYGRQPDEDFEAWQKRLFWDKPRENMDREERTAAGNFERHFYRNPEPTEITFSVVERTIVIPNP